jgi:hypothetical protein
MNVSGTSRVTFHVWVVAALAFVLALAGCGGGEERGSKAEEGVSKQEFIGKADAICTEANERRDALQSPELAMGLDYPGAVAKYATTMERVYVDALTKLKGLEVPRNDEETIKAMLAKFEQAFTHIPDVAAAGRERDGGRIESAVIAWTNLAIEGQSIAHKYGSKECARFGIP